MNVLTEYYQLLAEAFEANRAIDDFDLDSSSEESRADFGRLSEESDAAQRALLDHVRLHLTELTGSFSIKT